MTTSNPKLHCSGNINVEVENGQLTSKNPSAHRYMSLMAYSNSKYGSGIRSYGKLQALKIKEQINSSWG